MTEREYLLYFHDGRVRRAFGKLSEFQKLPVARIEEVPEALGKGEMTGSNPREGQEIEIPTPQLQDVYKRWKGLEPTGVEEVDRVREYYIGLLRKELQERGALPSGNPGQRHLGIEEREARRVLGLPEEERISPALAIPIGLSLGLASVVGMFALALAAAPEPSALLISYQHALDEAYIAVEAGLPEDLVMVPGYGLIDAESAIPMCIDFMIAEAISIGLISSEGECYFVRAIMYYSDGTIIVG